MSQERADKLLALQLEWIKSADTKVSPIFAINIAMLGTLTTLVKPVVVWTFWSASTFALCAGLLLISIGYLASCIFPRLSGPKQSNVFFVGIANQKQNDFKDNFNKLSQDNYLDDTLNQIHRNAEIAKGKYADVKSAFKCTFVSVPLWLVSIYLLFV